MATVLQGFQAAATSRASLRLLGSARVDGAGGDDRLTLDELAPGSSTLIGGAGDDTIEGAGQDNPGQSSWHADLVGRSDDRLDGGAGEPLTGINWCLLPIFERLKLYTRAPGELCNSR